MQTPSLWTSLPLDFIIFHISNLICMHFPDFISFPFFHSDFVAFHVPLSPTEGIFLIHSIFFLTNPM